MEAHLPHLELTQQAAGVVAAVEARLNREATEALEVAVQQTLVVLLALPALVTLVGILQSKVMQAEPLKRLLEMVRLEAGVALAVLAARLYQTATAALGELVLYGLAALELITAVVAVEELALEQVVERVV